MNMGKTRYILAIVIITNIYREYIYTVQLGKRFDSKK